MPLHRYLELASGLPVPTREQVEAFVAHLQHAHSWYKHLPILPPGRPFHLYLDPGAGMTRVVRDDGQFGVKMRSDKECFHHSWFSTEETRSRFGFLSFAVAYPRAVVQPHDVPSLLDPDLGIDVHLPEEAIRAGKTVVSGLIHVAGTNYSIILLQAEGRSPAWPNETGGAQQEAKVLERCRALANRTASPETVPNDAARDDETRWALRHLDWNLYQLLTPERQRQLDGLVNAAERAKAFAYGTRHAGSQDGCGVR